MVWVLGSVVWVLVVQWEMGDGAGPCGLLKRQYACRCRLVCGGGVTVHALPCDRESVMKLLPRIFRQSKDPADAVVLRRLEESIESAGYWAKRMPREAARVVRKVRLYTLAAAVLSLVTGLLAWPVIGGSSQLTAQVFVSVLSGLAALAVVVPHATGLSDRGDESIRLCSTYGAVYRELVEVRGRLAAGSLDDPSRVADVIGQFEHIQERRDALALVAGDGHLGGACGVGAVRGGGRWGRTGLGGLREITGPLLPSARVRPQAGRTAGGDDEAVLAALVCVLRGGCEPRRVPLYSRVSSSMVYRLFRVRSRAGGRVASSPGVLDVSAGWGVLVP